MQLSSALFFPLRCNVRISNFHYHPSSSVKINQKSVSIKKQQGERKTTMKLISNSLFSVNFQKKQEIQIL